LECLEALARAEYATPRDILGPHPAEEGFTLVRTIQPDAREVRVETAAGTVPMERRHAVGIFEARIPSDAGAYRFRVVTDRGEELREDPYRFPLQLTDLDLYLHAEGTHYRAYLKMGAHPLVVDGVEGVNFAVWAPNARRVSVVGDFNRWDGRAHPMHNRGASGIWEIFIPGVRPGDLYKYEILGAHGHLLLKADPYAFASELRPRTASVVWSLDGYRWEDEEWMQQRRERDWLREPVAIYEVHLGSWRRVPEEGNRWLSYRELADTLVPYVKDMGYTHVELMPVSEHPYDGSWGYQTIGYFAPTSRFGTPDDFKYFVDRCHQAGLAVILDWVPAHFPKDGHGLGFFDGTHLYEHADPRRGEHLDWGTLIFNYGRNEVRAFLLSNALFWADIYHIDGLRVDAVASMLYLDYSRPPGEWIPNQYGGRENLEAIDFIKRFNELMHGEYPGLTTHAEESTAWPMVSRPTYLGGLGFTFKWNMGWMHDMLEYMGKDPIYRKYHHQNLTFSLLYAFSENFILPFSHDEVVHGKRALLDKMPGDLWQKFANLRLLYAYMYAHPGKKLLFMGGEFGQWREWDCHQSLDWHLLEEEPHRRLQQFVRDLNRIYRSQPALYEVDYSWQGFEWIDFHDSEQSIVSFVRRAADPADLVVAAFNFTPVPRPGYRIGLPRPGYYRELLNTDSRHYGGTDVGNAGGVTADDIPWQGQPYSAEVTLPPLGAIYLKPE